MTARMSLAELLGGLVDEVPAVMVTGLCLDSRQLRPGEAFIALAGTSSHGMAHVPEAIERGAAVIIHDGRGPRPLLDLPQVMLPGLSGRLPELARLMWGRSVDSLKLTAVTGTNGKTSVAWLLAQMLEGAVIGTLGSGRPGTLEPASLTTPDIFSVYRRLAELAAEGLSTVAIEASSHALDQGRLEGLSWRETVFTCLGHDHLDYHVDLTAYGEAKARLFIDHQSGFRLINVDDEFGRELAARLSGQHSIIRFGLDPAHRPDVTAELISADGTGLTALLRLDGREFEVHSRLLGRVNLYNLLIVATIAQLRGIESDEIAERMARLEPVPGRMQPVSGPNGRSVVIDYAHTPDALNTALASLRPDCAGQLWCVFGCGGNRDRAKRPLMGRIAESLADRVILTDDNPRHEDGLAIIREIQAGMTRPERCRVIRDRAEAIRYAVTRASGDDLVLIAGKGHETEQIIGDRRLPFSDQQVVRQALEDAA